MLKPGWGWLVGRGGSARAPCGWDFSLWGWLGLLPARSRKVSAGELGAVASLHEQHGRGVSAPRCARQRGLAWVTEALQALSCSSGDWELHRPWGLCGPGGMVEP